MRGYRQLLDHAVQARETPRCVAVTIGTIVVRLVSKIAQKCTEPRIKNGV
jgi:hypothetical protein